LVALAAIRLGMVDRQMVYNGYVKPVSHFFQCYGRALSLWLLALVGFYRLSDIVLGAIANVFYLDLGFTKQQIAGIVKTYGLVMTLLGGFCGGALTLRFGVMPILLWGAILSACTNLLFMVLAQMGNHVEMLYVVIAADNLAGGLAVAAFVAFLSSLTQVSFTAVQYAIFSSLMTLFPKLISGYSGTLVDAVGYSTFFALTAMMGVPVIAVLWQCWRQLQRRAANVEHASGQDLLKR
ncbi:MAG: MFS transporter, partial [Gammaproteobacteria bacterium]